MTLTRTPESNFTDIPDYPYDPDYVDVGGPEMAYVDVAGKVDSDETFLCLHGEPTWGFLYRKMIPELSEAGRVVVPDFVGFGRSDKYTNLDDYSFELFYETLTTFIERLDLTNVTLVCQDWGGVVGLPVALLEHPGRFARLVPMNTGTPTGKRGMINAWWGFRDYMLHTEDPEISTVIEAVGDFQWYHERKEQPEPWTAPVENEKAGLDLHEDVKAAYDAPFHSPESKAGARRWPSLVPTDTDIAGAEIGQRAVAALQEWEKPAFVLFSDGDPVTRETRDAYRSIIPSAEDQPDVWIEGAGHFLQEEAGEEVAKEIVNFVGRTKP